MIKYARNNYDSSKIKIKQSLNTAHFTQTIVLEAWKKRHQHDFRQLRKIRYAQTHR